MVMVELTVEFLEVHAAGLERDAAPPRMYRESRTERGPFHERRKRVRDVPRLPTKWRASNGRQSRVTWSIPSEISASGQNAR